MWGLFESKPATPFSAPGKAIRVNRIGLLVVRIPLFVVLQITYLTYLR